MNLAKDQQLDIKHVNNRALHGSFGEIEEGIMLGDALMQQFSYEAGLDVFLGRQMLTLCLDEQPSTTDLWLMLVGSWVDEDLDIRAFCLILERVDENHASFRRVGVGWTSSENLRGLRTGELAKEARCRVVRLFYEAKRMQGVLV